jgi:regulator of sigma E protease
MFDTLKYILAIAFVFGSVIAIHELGHFIAAKLMGVYAPRFSIGFGPTLWRRRKGETEYILAALPVGGYVRMASKDDESIAFLEGGSEAAAADANAAKKPADWDENAMVPFGPKPVPANRYFESKPLVGRVFILLAGVAMNFVLAVVVFTGMQIGYGRPVIPSSIDSLAAGKPAERAGLKVGDSVTAVDGKPVSTWQDLVERIRSSPGVPVTLEIARKGEAMRRSITLSPEAQIDTNPMTGEQKSIGIIGVYIPRDRGVRDRIPVGEAITGAWRTTAVISGATIDVLVGLFRRKVALSQLGGPIAIAKSSVAAAKSGFEQLLGLLAIISINVAVFNLLPIPILDGGQILMIVAERVKGKPFSLRTREYILRAGLVAIMLILALVMFNDLGMRRLFG